MKTKVLLLAAAIFAVGASTSMAQVYSANAVGYVNLTLPPGFSLLANPLDNTNNSVNTLFPGVPNNTLIYRFNALNTPAYSISRKVGAAFTVNFVLDPGEGFFIFIPGTTPVNVTFVGEVPQGNLVNPLLVGNYQIKGSMVPQSLPLGRPNSAVGVATLGYPAATNDVAFTFSNTGGYSSATFRSVAGGVWSPGGVDGPTIGVASGFFLFRSATATSGDWTRTFSVN